MKLDEFAFVNQQLAGMLQSGVPIEGALRELCRTMRRGELRAELEALAGDLGQGSPLAEALSRPAVWPFTVSTPVLSSRGCPSGQALTSAVTITFCGPPPGVRVIRVPSSGDVILTTGVCRVMS